MLRSALLTATLALGLGSFIQAQVVNYGGYATTAPTANVAQNPSIVNAQGAPSVPAINTPVAHVGPQAGIANQPGETANQSTAVTAAPAQPEVVQIQNPGANPLTVQVAPNQNGAAPVNLGVASYSENPFLTSSSGDNGKSLGEVAREMKQRDQNLNAKTYTNADIDRLNPSSGQFVSAEPNADNSYPANNGVIMPSANNSQNSIASPVQNQTTTTGNGPFSPRPQTTTPDNNAPNAAPPQANAKPSAGSPYQMAANNPPNAAIPQAGNDQNTGAPNQSGDKNNQQLPKTASRLPLIGILGFFSISMGLFVRYQRAKTSK